MTEAIFSLDILPARKGDCLLLHYGTTDAPKLWVIDGGPSNVYNPALRPRLHDLRAARGLADTEPLPIEMLMVSHIDDDHIKGILEFAKELKDFAADDEPAWAKVDTLWHNVFDDILDNTPAQMNEGTAALASLSGGGHGGEMEHDVEAVFASVGQGHKLREFATFFQDKFGVGKPTAAWNINRHAGELVMMETANDPPIAGFAGLEITILGPTRDELTKLQEKWDKYLREKGLGQPSAEATLAAIGKDRSVTNLASIVALVKCGEHSILLTGDALGEKILEALEARELTSEAAPLEVDILKLQHHGSNRNVSREFFRKVRARHYIFSGDGEHGNPERDTVEMLLAEHDGREITLHFSNAVDEIDAKRKEEHHGDTPWSDSTHSLRALFDTHPAIAIGEPTDRKGIRIDLKTGALG